jgi:uncharacterized protein YjbI with pentapeptide repeats
MIDAAVHAAGKETLQVRHDAWAPDLIWRDRMRRANRPRSQRYRRLLRWLSRWSKSPSRLFRWIRRWTEPAWPALAVAVILALALLCLHPAFPRFAELAKGIYIAAWGTFLDVVLVAVILVIFEAVRQRRERIERHLEEIEDYKKWDSEEARLRIAGNIRRLARLGKTDIDFSGLVLRNFSFTSQDIQSLAGATFGAGLRFDRMSKNDTQLENVDFSLVNCRGVVFSRSFGTFAALGLIGKNLNFTSSNLAEARFDGARLSWTDYKADEADWFIDEGQDDEGRRMTRQDYYPAFDGANLTGCSFRYAELDLADFRGAMNILKANFTGAKGLGSCFFDAEVRDKVLASATSTPALSCTPEIRSSDSPTGC